MKRKIIAILIACMVLGLSGCGSETALSDTTKKLTPEETDGDSGSEKANAQGTETNAADQKKETEEGTAGTFTDRYNQFAVKLLQQTYEAGKNEMLSPMSILAALTMTENGAKGETLAQMEQVLSGGVSVTQQGEELSSYMKSLPDEEGAHLGIANSIWIKDDDLFQVENDFLKKNTSLFDAEVYQAPFDEHTLKDINTWVSNKTEQMIPEILEKIDEDSLMYLVNAVAFDAKWMDPYMKESVRDGIFTRTDGSTEDISLMNSEESVYLEDADTTGFIRPYENGYYFVALLPNEDIAIDDYVRNFSAEQLENLLQNAIYSYDVYAAMPKFKSEYSIKLNDTLKAMGITDAFDGEKADFTGLGTYADGSNIYISEVIHKTYIEVDEQGTKASAATSVGMAKETSMRESITKNVILDRPFVYAIIDSENELPIFLGVVESVTK